MSHTRLWLNMYLKSVTRVLLILERRTLTHLTLDKLSLKGLILVWLTLKQLILKRLSLKKLTLRFTLQNLPLKRCFHIQYTRLHHRYLGYRLNCRSSLIRRYMRNSFSTWWYHYLIGNGKNTYDTLGM